jgi:hypothetical protein
LLWSFAHLHKTNIKTTDFFLSFGVEPKGRAKQDYRFCTRRSCSRHRGFRHLRGYSEFGRDDFDNINKFDLAELDQSGFDKPNVDYDEHPNKLFAEFSILEPSFVDIAVSKSAPILH